MEDNGWLILLGALWIGWWILKSVIRSRGGGGGGAGGDAGEDLQIRVSIKEAEGEDDLAMAEIEAIGSLDNGARNQVRFVLSALDMTDHENPLPVLSAIDVLQEEETIAFNITQPEFDVPDDAGLGDWVGVGSVPVDLLMPPAGGSRRIVILLRIVDPNNPPDIQLGFADGQHPGLLNIATATIQRHYPRGYEDAAEEMVEGAAVAVRLAVAVCYADGSFDESEGQTVSDWIRRLVAGMPEGRRQAAKDACNSALVEANSAAKTGDLSLSALTGRMNELGDTSLKYQAIELCLDVMVSDGEADEAELALIRNLANAMDIDYDELTRLQDQRTVALGGDLAAKARMESVLGIDADWPKDRIQRHLRDEFRKWNGRLNSLTDEAERANAQQRLDLIAEARQKYG